MIEPYKPLFIHLNPASIPEVVAHMQRYLIEHTFVTVEEFGIQFQEYIEAHPEIIKVASVNGQEGDVLLTSTDIPMAQGSTDTVGSVIADIQEEAGTAGETLDDLVLDMDTVKTDIATLENVFTGATEESSGIKGLVPAPANTQVSHYLRASGNFEAIPAREVLSNAVSEGGTVETALAALKTKLDELNNWIVYTSPGSIISGGSFNPFRCIYNPALKLVCLKGHFACTSAQTFNAILFTIPDEVPEQYPSDMSYNFRLFADDGKNYGAYVYQRKIYLSSETPANLDVTFTFMYICQ